MNRAGDGMPNLFARAASLLLGDMPAGTDDLAARSLLNELGYASAANSREVELGR